MDRVSLNGSDWEFKEFVGEDWIWRDAHKRETKDVRWWKKGNVPGTVADDLYRLKEIPDPYFERNSLLIEWVPERTWIYRKRFAAPAQMQGKRVTLCFAGVDYDALIYFNDVYLGRHEGMFTPFSFDITKLISYDTENQLSVVISKAPDEQPQVSKTSYVKTHKSRMTYWWDFCPRMIHQGIWEEVYLEAHGDAVIDTLFVRPILQEDGSSAKLMLSAKIKAAAQGKAILRFLIAEEGGRNKTLQVESALFVGETQLHCETTWENPLLWWPNNSGEQPLYQVKATLLLEGELCHTKEERFGIRSVVFSQNDGAEPFADAYCISVNGVRMYIKGWNWVPIDVMYGVPREEKYRHLLTLAKEANVNMLRVWGGGLIERELFYRICDEYGIMIWQEFIQSSSGIDNKPSQEAAFLDLMEKEAEQIVPGKRNHPSLVIWCGGNELQSENQSMIKESEPVIARLRRVVRELDPDRKFLSSSPTGRIFNNELSKIIADPKGLHDVHGPWEHQGLTAQYTLYNAGTALLSSEYGVEGMTNWNTLKKSMDEEHMWPPSRDNFIYFHRGSWWNNYGLVQESFGNRISQIKEMIMASQLLQYEGLKYAVESNRRRAFQSSGSLMWQFNEPYPNNYCTSSVDYYGQPKPVYHGIKRAYGAYAVTAAFLSQTLSGREQFHASVYVHSSLTPKAVAISCRVVGAGGTNYWEETLHMTADGESKKAGEIMVDSNKIQEDFFLLILEGRESSGQLLMENRYLFSAGQDLEKLLEKKETILSLTYEGEKGSGMLRVKNEGQGLAAGVMLSLLGELVADEYAYFSDNYLYLLPGEIRSISVKTNKMPKEGTIIGASGFMAKEVCCKIW